MAANISTITVKRFEGGETLRAASVARMTNALSEAGITFIADGDVSPDGGEGVRFNPSTGRG